MFSHGIKKTAATSLKNYITAIANREIKIDKALRTATKGKSREMHKRLRSVQDLQKRIDHPLSMELMEMAKQKGVLPSDSARVAKTRRLGRLGEHAKYLQKTTREPMKAIREETRTLARRKKHYAKEWGEVSKTLTEKLKKMKRASSKKAPAATAAKKRG